MKYFSYLNTAADILGLYRGQQPFHLFIKDFFRQHKKYGSTDRKQVTHLCYCFFRLGNSLEAMPLAQKILTGFFLCTDRSSDLLAYVQPQWNEKITLGLKEKCIFLNIPFEALTIFPCPESLGTAIEKEVFQLAHLQQPDVFLRVRPGHQQTVTRKLRLAGISYTTPRSHCIALANTTKIDGIIQLNKEAVVQDYSSQCTSDLLPAFTAGEPPVKTWDCCAASGGKSIMAKDALGNIELTVSDKRESVLVNLKKRFEEAGLGGYRSLVTDLSARPIPLVPASFQLIIADVPCTGSGTWGRNPEHLSFFDGKEIDRYQSLQQKIITAVMPFLQSGGYLLYITCSVFKKENEDMAVFIREHFNVTTIDTAVLKGYTIKADTLFAALFRMG